ncbi:MAG: thioredoxin domain-containing protein [Candidatus Dormibacteraeota bacterium]|uniref:Thioredoxin domain-containing protein n=1 Tax=Candidatus Aeolococcus gillhamiae TaxID=3127015 RepID=A0A2W5ZBI2_9BACT|nr:thioredoxin domain-containing protein [Candidatus Dormibacteraeota bacterium]PZR80205.1 MAG: thioredoxin domain-containing protein [Candidatus Dormibacter sp. RRmetagenome_bin12]
MSNRLALETSPYLLQHATNPVDWYPWGEEAFARARAEDRPVLLSIGYSACHWCHVMAHESFEDERIATLMNALFVNIKVDREERPDVDSIYMQAVIAISGHGGWPMTVFLTPAGEPFFGGTYFPPVDRQGMRGFDYVLNAAATVYRDRRGEVTEAAAQLRRALEPAALPPGSVSAADLGVAATQLVAQTDMRHGGFGGAPKFPHAGALDFLLRRYHTTGDRRLLDAALVTLDHMDRGGIHDQVGGGFHRYAVDATWSIPHFEKMLYDNAQLAPVYLHAYQLTGDQRWRRVAEDTLDHAMRELRLPGGGFASSQDADSPGGEGSYFVWALAQLREVLGEEDGTLAARVFGVTDVGNFEGGTTVLSQPFPLVQVARSLDTDEAALRNRLDGIRARLLEARRQRAAPARDDKVLTAWNALMISALAEAGAALGRADYLDGARRGADFLLAALRPDGVLLRTWKDGSAKITGFLEDSAFFAEALITLYEACGDGTYLASARELVDDAVRRFEDGGVMYDTASDAEPLLVRPRTIDDNPVPAGQSILASALLRLAAFTGDAALRERAETILGPLAAAATRSPLAVSALASALDRAQAASREVAITGAPHDERTRSLLDVVHRRWTPNTVLAWGNADVELLADRPLVDGRPAAYVCENFACQRPVTEPEELAALLD